MTTATPSKPTTTAPKYLKPAEIAKRIIDFIKAGLADGSVGAWCVGKLRREKKFDALAIHWDELGPFFLMKNPDISVSVQDLMDFMETSYVTERLRKSVDGRAMRHQFCTKEFWDQHYAERVAGTRTEGVKWSHNPRARFYDLEATGLEPNDFVHFTNLRVVKDPVFTPMRLREGDERTESVIIALNISQESIDDLEATYQTLPVATVVRFMIVKALENSGANGDSVIPGISNSAYAIDENSEHLPVRKNIWVDIEVDDTLRLMANTNRVRVSVLIRSIIEGDPFWKLTLPLELLA